MKIELSSAELQVLMAPQANMTEEVIRLNAERVRLEEKLSHNQARANVDSELPSAAPVINALTHVCAALVSSNKILAIKITRELTGVGLREAKDIVEGNYSGPGVRKF